MWAGDDASTSTDPRPLVLHLVYRFDTGGLENGVVNLVNHMSGARYRHAVVALTDVAAGFARRVQRDDVRWASMHKGPGHALAIYPSLFRLFRQWRPAVVHTRNLAALECQVPAWLARVPARVHGEHGRDVDDPDGTRVRYQRIRQIYRPFVHRYVALSRDLERYLVERVGIDPKHVSQIYNGVDTARYRPAGGRRAVPVGCPFMEPDLFLVGTVGRMQSIKAQTLLVRAFVALIRRKPEVRQRLRLVLVGSGPLLAECESLLMDAGLRELAWLPGERSDVPEVMRGLDCFVLPSLAEGISNTILEAMASGLPVIATDVGGNAELVERGQTGTLVAADACEEMSAALEALASAPSMAASMGLRGRARVMQHFSLPAMVTAYEGLYDALLMQRR